MGQVCHRESNSNQITCQHYKNMKKKKKNFKKIQTNINKLQVCDQCLKKVQYLDFKKKVNDKKTKQVKQLLQINLNQQEFSQQEGLKKKSLTDFEIIRSLGRGAFGKVYMIKQKQKQSKNEQKLKSHVSTHGIGEVSSNQIKLTLQSKDSLQNTSVKNGEEIGLDQSHHLNSKTNLQSIQQSNLTKKIKSTNSFPKYYALKIIQKSKIQNDEDRIHTISQRYILETLDHPFLVKLHYAFQNNERLFLIVDLMPGGQLFFLLRKKKKFDQDMCKFYAAQIILAIEYLHSRKILYRDLKPQNILLDHEGHIKLTDFGLSKVCSSMKQTTYSLCGTPEYIAPEVILGNGYSTTADWFSLGSLLYDMLTGRPPFYNQNKSIMLENLITKSVPIPTNLSKQAQSLLKGLFQMKPKDRLGSKNDAQDIKNHEFFRDINFQQILNKKIKPPVSFEPENFNKKDQKLDTQNPKNQDDLYINETGFQKWNNSDIINLSYVGKIKNSKIHNQQQFSGFTYHI